MSRIESVEFVDPNLVEVFHDGAITHGESSAEANRVNRIARLLVKPALRWLPLNDYLLRKISEFDRPITPAGDIVTTKVMFGSVPGETFYKNGGPSSPVTLLYFHGGGFFAGSVNSYRRVLELMARRTGATVVSVDYRQLPEAHLAESVDDAITVYEHLTQTVQAPGQIVVAGDSAGGYLTFKVAELARRRGLVAPAALIGFSPMLSLDMDNPRKAVQIAVPVNDAYLPGKRVKHIRKRWLPEGAVIEGFADPFNAVDYISSPTFLLAGENELLRPETEAFATRLAEREVPVEFHVWRKQVHAFTFLVGVVPEAKVAVADALAFVKRYLPVDEAAKIDSIDSQA